MLSAAKDRPPYVTFEQRAVEDRAATIEAGCYVARNVNMALISPMGSKDRHERIAEEWIKDLALRVKEGRFPEDWARAYRAQFEEWKQGNAIPLNGTPIRSWPVVSPAQVSQLLALNVRTVEDLAGCNEETMMRLGMGARALRDKANTWLAEASGSGKLVEQLTALQLQVGMLVTQNAELQSRLQAQAAALAATRRPGSAPEADDDDIEIRVDARGVEET